MVKGNKKTLKKLNPSAKSQEEPDDETRQEPAKNETPDLESPEIAPDPTPVTNKRKRIDTSLPKTAKKIRYEDLSKPGTSGIQLSVTDSEANDKSPPPGSFSPEMDNGGPSTTCDDSNGEKSDHSSETGDYSNEDKESESRTDEDDQGWVDEPDDEADPTTIKPGKRRRKKKEKGKKQQPQTDPRRREDKGRSRKGKGAKKGI